MRQEISRRIWTKEYLAGIKKPAKRTKKYIACPDCGRQESICNNAIETCLKCHKSYYIIQ